MQDQSGSDIVPEARLVDELANLVSPVGARAEGRLYEIPMDARSILEDPGQAIDYMEQAVDRAAEWGARLVGLGSMTGIVGGQGEHLAGRGPLRVTTGNSLTVYAALQSLLTACVETDIDLARATVAVVGIPGSIATAARAGSLRAAVAWCLVGRRPSPRASRLAAELDAEFLVDIPSGARPGARGGVGHLDGRLHRLGLAAAGQHRDRCGRAH